MVDDLAPELGLPTGLPYEAATPPRWRAINKLESLLRPSCTVWVDDRPGQGSRGWADAPHRHLVIPRTITGMTDATFAEIEDVLVQSRGCPGPAS